MVADRDICEALLLGAINQPARSWPSTPTVWSALQTQRHQPQGHGYISETAQTLTGMDDGVDGTINAAGRFAKLKCLASGATRWPATSGKPNRVVGVAFSWSPP